MTTKTIQAGPSDDHPGFLKLSGRPPMEIGAFVTIGRDLVNNLVLHDDAVSSRHARIEKKDGQYILRDLRSRNGSFLNGHRVFEAVLTDGDRLLFGETEIVFSATVELPHNLGLSSKNLLWNEQLRRLDNIATSDLPILLTGPSGAGKEVLAQEIHRLSNRSHNPFISVNCSALSESLVESELFGHVRGSFTGASSDRRGAFESARGGTLFLDEIGDLPLSLQPKLLRALENKQIRPVGSDRTIETDVRIVTATHHHLRQRVEEGSFRADLYFRLHVVHIDVPALIERLEDFETLLYHFARMYRVGFSFDAIQTLKRHTWPGNIRELKNVVARAKAFFPGRQVEASDLSVLVELPRNTNGEAPAKPSRSLIREIEQEMIRARLVANAGNQRRTAADLGIPKSTLHDRIRSYGIDIEKLLEDAGIRKI